jgi:hypothetical protein
MANVDKPFGLKPVRHMSGGELRTNDYTIAASYTTAIYRGDVVEGVADGSIEIAEAGNVDNLGVFWGCSYVDSAGAQHFSNYWPGTANCTQIKAHVYDDPHIIFSIQSDATGAAEVDRNNGADIEYVAGSTATGVSKVNLDVSAGLGTTGKTFRILRLVEDGENAWGAYSAVEVIFNEHVMNGVVSGVGGI